MKARVCLLASLAGYLVAMPLTAPASTTSEDGVIVFSRYFRAAGDSALCVTDPLGSRTAILKTFDDQRVAFPAWSPDGSRIAFTRDEQVVLMDVGTGNELVLAAGSHPSWSPDGSSLTFQNEAGVNVIDADATDQRVLGTGRDPDWSPDGDRIAFDQDPDLDFTDGPEGELKTMALDGSDVVTLDYGQSAAWSPDATQLAHAYHDYWSGQLAVMNADGTDRRGLTDPQGEWPRPDFPSWSPDGTRVLYSWGQALWMVNGDGTERHRVLRRAGLADWGLVPADAAGLWDGRPCRDPARFVSLRLYGHLFGRGKVWTNDPARCTVSGITVNVWKKERGALRLSGTDETDAEGRYDMELRPYRSEGDQPGYYQARFGGLDSTDCARDKSRLKLHKH